MQITGSTSFKCGNAQPGSGFVLLLEGVNIATIATRPLEAALASEWPMIAQDAEWGEISSNALWIAREDVLRDPAEAQAAAGRIAHRLGAARGQALRVVRREIEHLDVEPI